ncbi:MAG TPA: amino acid-binding protein [Acidimicrobiaceae bacterium]|nr:amino acid-binding protein [Acidimicrobiaceae bacterium]
MATDITIYMTDQPGELGRVAQALADRGVNIDGFCAVIGGGGMGEIHVLVDDDEGAFRALADAAIEVASEQEVAVVDVDEDRPGVLAELSRRLGEAEVNITLAYLATGTRLVFAANDPTTVRRLLDGL